MLVLRLYEDPASCHRHDVSVVAPSVGVRASPQDKLALYKNWLTQADWYLCWIRKWMKPDSVAYSAFRKTWIGIDLQWTVDLLTLLRLV